MVKMGVKRCQVFEGFRVEADITRFPADRVQLKFNNCDYCYKNGGPIECWESGGKLWYACHRVADLMQPKEDRHTLDKGRSLVIDAVVTVYKGD